MPYFAGKPGWRKPCLPNGHAEAERLSINRNARTRKPQTSKDASHGTLLFIDDEAQWNMPPPLHEHSFLL